MGDTEVIVRPNGKEYRRRKPLSLHTYYSDGGDGLIVMGTHDVERAQAAADRTLDELDLLLAEPRRRWLRLVPWDAYGLGVDRSWVEDEVRGTPCVDWMPPW